MYVDLTVWNQNFGHTHSQHAQPDRIKRLLNSTGTGKTEIKDKLEGMKYLLAVCFLNYFLQLRCAAR